MKDELEQKLYNKYPELFKQKDLPMTETCMCWGIECGDGWYNIIDSVCVLVVNHNENLKLNDKEELDFQFTQIKEKYGTLRLYGYGADEYIEGIIQMAESMSEVICEVCGGRGKINAGTWYRVRCKEHWEESFDYDAPCPCKDIANPVKECDWHCIF